MRSTLVLATTALGGTVVAAIAAPPWLAVLLAAGLVTGAMVARRDRGAPRPAAPPAADVDDDLASRHTDAVLVFSSDGRLERSSSSIRRLLGWEDDELRAMRLEHLVHPDDVAAVRTTYRAVVDRRSADTIHVQLRTSRAWMTVAMTIEPGDGEEGATRETLVHLRDISDWQDVQRLLDQREAQLVAAAAVARHTLDSSDESTLVGAAATMTREALAADGCEIYRTTGVAPELVAGVGPGGIMVDRRSATLSGAALAAEASTGRVVWEVGGQVVQTPGDDAPVSAIAVPIGEGDDVDGAIIVRSRTSRRFDDADVAFLDTVSGLIALARRCRNAEQAAFRRSRHDELTGLVNREVFVERLQTSIARSGPGGESVAVLLVDLDHFKIINDSLGHAAGDALLAAVSERLSEALRPGDLLARFGGDEFVVLARRLASPDHARLAAERLQTMFAAPFPIENHEVQVTASVGLSVCSDSTTEAGVILQEADVALYRAKELGRERVVVFEPALLDAAVTRLRVEEELRLALTDDQLRVFYQPIVDLGTGRADRVEALVRWVHPTRGLVSPAEFIPISERTGLIEEVGAWVLDDVARQCRIWQDAGSPMRVSVNVSGRQLTDAGLPATITEALARHGVEPHDLAIEVTERALAAEGDAALSTLRTLADLGVGIVLDDFGTGLGSIASLRGLPIELVKIDKIFIDEVDRSGEGYAITAALVQLASVVGSHVVAEGVESDAQLELLRDLGCDLAQGYLFSPAVFDLETGSSDRNWTRRSIDH